MMKRTRDRKNRAKRPMKAARQHWFNRCAGINFQRWQMMEMMLRAQRLGYGL